MKTTLGTEADLCPGHILLDGVPALRERDTPPPPSAHVYCGNGRPSQTAEPLYVSLYVSLYISGGLF